MRALKPVPKNWPIPLEDRCVYEKSVNGGPCIRCRYTQRQHGHRLGYCGIHARMMERRQQAKNKGRPHGMTC